MEKMVSTKVKSGAERRKRQVYVMESDKARPPPSTVQEPATRESFHTHQRPRKRWKLKGIRKGAEVGRDKVWL